MGPVAIADLSGSAASAGWIPLFTLMAMISVNLGILNLMPVPVLDGGHIMILALEGLARRDFSMKAKEKMLGAGFILLLMLMVTVIYNDLMRIPWIAKLVQIGLLTTSVLAFLFVLGVLIFVHELGHFLMARRIGVRVLTFSLGFGPKLINVKRGDTEYCISAIPLGGYVKMAGENPEDSRTGALRRVPVEGQVAAVPGPRDGPDHEPGARRRRDGGRPLPGRAGARLRAAAGRHRRVLATTRSAAKAGLKLGDRIITVDGKHGRDVGPVLDGHRVRKPSARCRSASSATAGRRRSPSCPEGQGKYELGDIGIQPLVHPAGPRLRARMTAAAAAGLQAGTSILAAAARRTSRANG